MSTHVPSVLPTDPARGGGEHTQLYHTPDGNGRALAPEGVDVAAGSAGSTLLAKSDAKSKKSTWLEEAMDTVVKAFQGDKDPTRTRTAGGRAAEDESRDLGGPSNFSATATANANNTEAVDAADYEEFLEEEGVEGDTATPSMMVAKLIQDQAGVEAQKQLEVFLRQTVTPQLTALQNELQGQVERNKADQAAFQAVLTDMREQLEQEKAKVKELEAEAASRSSSATTPAAKPTPGDPVEVLTSAFREAMKELQTAQGRPDSTGGRRLTFGDRLGDEIPFDFMAPSKVAELSGSNTGVTVKEGLAAMPDSTHKPDLANFYSTCAEDRLLERFTDDLSHAAFVDQRRKLVLKLAGLGYAQADTAGREGAENAVCRYLLGSLRYFEGKAARAKLSAVQAQVSADETGGISVNTVRVLELLDSQFASPTQVERDRELTMELGRLRVDQGVLPSMIITQAQLIYSQMFGSGQAALVERTTRSFVTQTIGEQAVGLKVLQPFADKLLDANFAKSSLADWQAQFRIFEKQSTFLEAMKRSQEAKATRPSRQVNYLTGHSTEDDFSHQEPQDSSSGSDLLEQLAQLLAGGEVKAKGGKKEAAGRKAEDAAFVRRLVAALGGDRTAKDRDWVEANGVPGFAPPDDPRREPLHIGKVCKALSIKVPAKCPKDPSALVGPECPCGQVRGIGDDNWYYAPGSDEFKSGDPKFTKRPAMGEKFGYYHKLGKCKVLRAEAHKLAKRDAAHIPLLSPLPRECGDCLSC